jgi:hypothetical protein
MQREAAGVLARALLFFALAWFLTIAHLP